jgi:uncharacterized protein YbjQ (UPF0145 family)
MKKIYFGLSLLILLSSCSFMRSPAMLIANSLDYSIYQKKGFFFTEASSVSFEYSPVSSVSATNYSGYELANQPGKVMDDVYGREIQQTGVKTTNKFIPASKAKVLEAMYQKALESGANGIINLKIEYVRYYVEKGYYVDGYQGTGMAIKK